MNPDQFPWVFAITVVAALVFSILAVKTKDIKTVNASVVIAFMFTCLAMLFGLIVSIAWIYKFIWEVMPI